jgi:CRISPR/Cas system-associated exonuclease Cas4 (RecB family)
MEKLQKLVEARGWLWETNGLAGGQLQVNIKVGEDVFCWWPLSAKRTFYHKKVAGVPGQKILKYYGVDLHSVVRNIERRLSSLYQAGAAT